MIELRRAALLVSILLSLAFAVPAASLANFKGRPVRSHSRRNHSCSNAA